MWRIKKVEKQPGENEGPKNPQANQSQMATPEPEEGTTKMNKTFMRPTEAIGERIPTRLGASVHVKGDIHGNEDLSIEGEVEGLVHLDAGNLTVGRTAKLTANITAGQV